VPQEPDIRGRHFPGAECGRARWQDKSVVFSELADDGSTNQGYWAWRRMAKRMKEISYIFRAVFGDGQMMTRVRPVLAAQLANPSIFRRR
jgi:hypothetical protein